VTQAVRSALSGNFSFSALTSTLLFLTMLSLPAPLHAEEAAPRTLFVPVVQVGAHQEREFAAPDPGEDSNEGAQGVCQLTEQESALAAIMTTHPDQGRDALNCNPILAQVARARAEDMARRAYFDHVNPDGFGPNYLVRLAGFPLLSWYDQRPEANNIESIAAGYETAAQAFAGWIESPQHRLHVLGQEAFYAGQEMYGVGHFYLEGSPYGSYWVVLSAPKPE
jgi:uncharacterized protein YkwD